MRSTGTSSNHNCGIACRLSRAAHEVSVWESAYSSRLIGFPVEQAFLPALHRSRQECLLPLAGNWCTAKGRTGSRPARALVQQLLPADAFASLPGDSPCPVVVRVRLALLALVPAATLVAIGTAVPSPSESRTGRGSTGGGPAGHDRPVHAGEGRPHLHHRQHARRPDAARRLARNVPPRPPPAARPHDPQPRLLRRRDRAAAAVRRTSARPTSGSAANAPIPQPSEIADKSVVIPNRFEKTDTKADVIFAFFGYNESFAGEAGLPKFKDDLEAFDQAHAGAEVQRQVRAAAGAVLADRVRGPQVAEPAERRWSINKNLELLHEGDGRGREGQRRSLRRSLSRPTQSAVTASRRQPLTINGVHLTEDGNRKLAEVIDAAPVPGRGHVRPAGREAPGDAPPGGAGQGVPLVSSAIASPTATPPTAAGRGSSSSGGQTNYEVVQKRTRSPRRHDRQPRQGDLGGRAGQGREAGRLEPAEVRPGQDEQARQRARTARTCSSPARRRSRA